MPKTHYVSPGCDLQAVFDAALPGDTVCLAAGEYRQKTVIRVPGLTVTGAGAEKTRIVFNDYARKRDPSGKEYVTFRTYTLAVCADGVTVKELSLVNDAGQPEVLGQQVALSVIGDDFLMEGCVLSSTQDTLFSGPLPPDLIERYRVFFPLELCRGGELKQRFVNCRIEGTVDFIFGSGNAVFERCQLRSVTDARNVGYVAAPSHTLYQQEGFRFVDCDFTFAPGVSEGSIYLARPWRDHGLCEFINCRYDRHIAPEGFDRWADSRRDRTARFRETPAVEGRVSWVNER